MTQRISYLLILLGILTIWACSTGRFSFIRGEGENPALEIVEIDPTPTPPGVDPTPTPPGGGGDTTRLQESWIQPPPQAVPADILFIQDTSGSLNAERQSLVQALSGFLGSLENKNIEDYCVGVILAHGGTRTGALHSVSTVSDKCLCINDYDSISDLRSDFSKILLNNKEESSTDGGEVGIYSFYQSFTTKLAENQAEGCYRDNAAVVPIFVSDENDISTSPDQDCGGGLHEFSPTGPGVRIDPNCKETPARILYHEDAEGNLVNGHRQVRRAAQRFQGILPYVSAVVGYVGENLPANNEDEYPYGYAEMTIAAGGDLVDLKIATDGDQSAFNAAFENLGETLAKKIKLTTIFDLSKKSCEDSIEVKVDGAAVTDFDRLSDTRITIPANKVGSEGSEIIISYDVCE